MRASRLSCILPALALFAVTFLINTVAEIVREDSTGFVWVFYRK